VASEREGLIGTRAAQLEGRLPKDQAEKRQAEVHARGLEAAPSVRDRTIPLFARGNSPRFAGMDTFLRVPYLDDMRDLHGYDVAFVGEPLDTGTTYRPGARFGPAALRRISALASGYSLELGIDLTESLRMVDVGDVHVIPGNIEKSFDQITEAMRYIFATGVFPVVLGGDHSVGYANVRAIAPYIGGHVGIIHFDRHADTCETQMDERMHGTPWFHATNIPNAPPSNLVQIGIGGWASNRSGITVCRERQTTIMTIGDVEHLGIERAAELALEVAWKNAKTVYLSFDIDCVDPAYAPGTGTPEPGGFTPREVFKLLDLVSKEGLCGMEVVEVSPPYDHAEITALLGGRIVFYVLASLVRAGKLGRYDLRPV
jgi:agmatinase